MNLKINLIALTSIFAILIFGFTYKAAAIEFGTPDKDTGNYTLSQETIVNDNLLTGGSNVSINGNVSKDLISGGYVIDVNGKIGNNAFLLANSLAINQNINGDLFAVAGFLKQSKNSVITGSVMACGGSITLDGEVKGNVKVAGGTVQINGKVDGNVKASAGKLIIGENAQIAGKIDYTSDQEASISPSAKVSGAVTKTVTKDSETKSKSTINISASLIELIMVLITGIVILWLFPKFSQSVTENISKKFWPSFGWGILTLIIIPVVIIITLSLIVTIPLSLILTFAYILAIYLCKIFIGLWLGNKIIKNKWSTIWAMSLGVFILSIIALIPYLGFIVNLLVLLAGLGAITLSSYQLKKQTK